MMSVEGEMKQKSVDFAFVSSKSIDAKTSEITKEDNENEILQLNNIQKKTSQKKRCPFQKEEDELLLYFVNQFGSTNKNIWHLISIHMNGRTARQCRERYNLFLNENVRKKSKWSIEEDNLLFYHYSQIGPHWKSMEKYFFGRTSYDLKNRYNSLMRQKRSYKNNPRFLYLSSYMSKKKINHVNFDKNDMQLPYLQINSSFCFSSSESNNDEKINKLARIKENSKNTEKNDDITDIKNQEENDDFAFDYDYCFHSNYFEDFSPNDSYTYQQI